LGTGNGEMWWISVCGWCWVAWGRWSGGGFTRCMSGCAPSREIPLPEYASHHPHLSVQLCLGRVPGEKVHVRVRPHHVPLNLGHDLAVLLGGVWKAWEDVGRGVCGQGRGAPPPLPPSRAPSSIHTHARTHTRTHASTHARTHPTHAPHARTHAPHARTPCTHPTHPTHANAVASPHTRLATYTYPY
jgi:hypothetical protein